MQEDATAAVPYQEAFVKDICDATGVYNSIFNFRKYSNGDVTTDNLNGADEVEDHIEWKPIKTHDPFEYDIAVEVLEAGGLVSVELKWWVGMVGEKQANNLAEGYKNMLKAILSKGDIVVADLKKIVM